jgi:hypothetical protein
MGLMISMARVARMPKPVEKENIKEVSWKVSPAAKKLEVFSQSHQLVEEHGD